MSGGVAGRLDHTDRPHAEIEAVAIADGPVEPRDCDRFVAGADDLAAEMLLQGQVRFDVVAMMMGGEDVGDRPAAPLCRGKDRRQFRRVDRGGDAGFLAMDENAEVIASAKKDFDFEGFHQAAVPSRWFAGM